MSSGLCLGLSVNIVSSGFNCYSSEFLVIQSSCALLADAYIITLISNTFLGVG